MSECLLSADTVWSNDVRIGDTVELIEGTADLDDVFAVKRFTVTGFVRSSYYTCSTNTGSTSLGSGELTSYVYVAPQARSVLITLIRKRSSPLTARRTSSGQATPISNASTRCSSA